MERILTLIVVVALTGCASNNEWRPVDTQRQILVTMAIAADTWSSRNIGSETGTQEVGIVARSLIGAHPSSEEFLVYFTVIAVADYYISRALPEKWRPFFQFFTFVEHLGAVKHNCYNQDIC